MRYKIYCEATADRDALVTILAKNGYTVRIGKEQKTKIHATPTTSSIGGKIEIEKEKLAENAG